MIRGIRKLILCLSLVSISLTILIIYKIYQKSLNRVDRMGLNTAKMDILFRTLYLNESDAGKSYIDLDLLLAPPRDTLEYERPKPLPGYRNPCFELDFDDVVAYGKSREDTRQMFAMEMVSEERGIRKCVVCFPSIYLMGVAKCGSTEITRYIQGHHQVYSGLFFVELIIEQH